MGTMPEKSVTFQIGEEDKMKEIMLPMSAVYGRNNQSNPAVASNRGIWNVTVFVSSFVGTAAG